jgi:hypothetical protein
MNQSQKNLIRRAMSLIGKSKSEPKKAAARKNGLMGGGRPRKCVKIKGEI